MKKIKEVLDRKTNSKELYLLSCGYEACPNIFTCGPIIRDYYILHFILKGSGNYYVNGKAFTVSKNQCFLIEPNISTLYQADPQNPWIYTWICFNGSLVPQILKKCHLDIDNPVISLPSSLKYYKIILNILKHHEVNPSNEYYIQSSLYLIFAKILQDKPTNYSNLELNENTYIEQAIHYIKQAPIHELNVEQIARHLNISQSYLYKLFKDQLNTSPHNFILNTKISKACELLIKTNIPIFNIAYNCGYKNAFAFSRAFKQIINISPRDYRKAYHKGIHPTYKKDK